MNIPVQDHGGGSDVLLENESVPAEIMAASNWWITRTQGLSEQQAALFQTSLENELMEKYRGHWRKEDPARGNAYRSILFDETNCDPVLLNAAHIALVSQVERRLPAEAVVMWVDPGNVTIKFLNSNKIKVVFDANGTDNSPAITSPASPDTFNCAQEYTCHLRESPNHSRLPPQHA